MRKIIEKSYSCLIYVFFALYMLLIRMDVEENKLIFYIGLFLGAIVLTIIPFFINKCKKIAVRRWYLICIVTLGAFISLQALVLILTDYVFLANSTKFESLNHVCTWILIISQALFVTSFIFMVFYTFKDFMKKDYSFQKFDLDALQMCLNILAYIAIVYIVFDFSGYEIKQAIDTKPPFEPISDPYLAFGSFDIVLKGILITSLVYIILYIVIKVISYYKFEKNNSNSNDMFK